MIRRFWYVSFDEGVRESPSVAWGRSGDWARHLRENEPASAVSIRSDCAAAQRAVAFALQLQDLGFPADQLPLQQP